MDAQNNNGETPFLKAIYLDQRINAEPLLLFGADPYIMDYQGTHPLDILTRNPDLKLIYNLIY